MPWVAAAHWAALVALLALAAGILGAPSKDSAALIAFLQLYFQKFTHM